MLNNLLKRGLLPIYDRNNYIENKICVLYGIETH